MRKYKMQRQSLEEAKRTIQLKKEEQKLHKNQVLLKIKEIKDKHEKVSEVDKRILDTSSQSSQGMLKLVGSFISSMLVDVYKNEEVAKTKMQNIK